MFKGDTPENMKIIFVRHGEPDYIKDCLTENGKKQAKNVAVRLKDQHIKAVFSSPMGRAKESAFYTASELGQDVQILDFMHEIDWGDREDNLEEHGILPYDGHPWTLAYRMLSESTGYFGSSNWPEHHYFSDNKCIDYYMQVSKSIDAFLANYGLVRKDGLYECTEENNDTVVIFAHGGSGAVLFSHIFCLPFPFVLTSMPFGVCSVSIIDFTAQHGTMVIPRLELFNDMGHIESFIIEKLHFEK